MNKRCARLTRKTHETDLLVDLTLEGSGRRSIETGIGFLDHLLDTLALHARFDLTLKCRGDLRLDDHHTAEDTALALGSNLDRALGERHGITRFGSALAPLDEALARAVVDLSGRPFALIHLDLKREQLGDLACENVSHVLRSFATAARLTLHLDVLRGENDHHRAEAAFKATALALRTAIRCDPQAELPSTKGTLV
ncbi:MAG: imidazoleglycerol-phosphate dehydratase HisB [Acidobacteriota bacterium]